MAEYQIELTGLTGFGYHGVLPEEREIGQDFLVDATLLIESPVVNDELANTVNYAEVAKIIHQFITGKPVELIETLADNIADHLMTLPLVKAVEVTVNKPSAPIDLPFENVSVTVFRGN
jgi:dihydroneopterin aldolase